MRLFSLLIFATALSACSSYGNGTKSDRAPNTAKDLCSDEGAYEVIKASNRKQYGNTIFVMYGAPVANPDNRIMAYRVTTILADQAVFQEYKLNAATCAIVGTVKSVSGEKIFDAKTDK